MVITEPGESYTAEFLRARFPHAKLIAVRYTNDAFTSSDIQWDAVWRPDCGSLHSFLINHIPDELLGQTAFVPWEPANRIWRAQAQSTWQEITYTIKVIQSEIATRIYFGKRWLLNTLRNVFFLERPVRVCLTAPEVLCVAAGFGLEQITRVGLPIVAVSSALQALLYRNISPDICMSTDGSFWAAEHFPPAPTLPVLFPLEACIPPRVFKYSPISLLNYHSHTEHFFLQHLHIPSVSAQRHGSVMGTALEYLLQCGVHSIYLAGLDLHPGKGFQHARPHASFKRFNPKRTEPLATCIAGNFDNHSLETYAHWFYSLPQEKIQKLTRLNTEHAPPSNVRTITYEDFSQHAFAKKDTFTFSEGPPISRIHKKAVLRHYFERITRSAHHARIASSIASSGIEKEAFEFLAYAELLHLRKNPSQGTQTLIHKVRHEIVQLRNKLSI